MSKCQMTTVGWHSQTLVFQGPPVWAPWTSGVRVFRVQPDQVAIGETLPVVLYAQLFAGLDAGLRAHRDPLLQGVVVVGVIAFGVRDAVVR